MTSVAFSPTLGHWIGLGLLPARAGADRRSACVAGDAHPIRVGAYGAAAPGRHGRRMGDAGVTATEVGNVVGWRSSRRARAAARPRRMPCVPRSASMPATPRRTRGAISPSSGRARPVARPRGARSGGGQEAVPMPLAAMAAPVDQSRGARRCATASGARRAGQGLPDRPASACVHDRRHGRHLRRPYRRPDLADRRCADLRDRGRARVRASFWHWPEVSAAEYGL